jgi:uncharacterized membrane protein YuzA (DUF378 family)
LTDSLLLQTLSEAAYKSRAQRDAEAKAKAEADLPPATTVLNALVAIGAVMGGSSGFNPMQMMTNIVGEAEMATTIDELMKFPLRFPDPTQDQLVAAEQVMLSVGLGFISQDDALNAFINTLTDEQRAMVDELEKHVIENVMGAMMTPDGEPSPRLIEEIKKEMHDMEERGVSSEQMPENFKRMVSDADLEAHAQALIAVSKDTSVDGKFKNFLPLVNQVVVYTTAVLPSVKAKKVNKHNNELTESLLVQTLAEAAGSSDEMADLEASLPSSETMVNAMVAIGAVMGGSSGFNPIGMMENIVGKSEMEAVVDEMMKFPIRFPDPTEEQLMAAEQVMLSVVLVS